MTLPSLVPVLLLLSLPPGGPAPQRVAIDLATLHAAALTTSRGAGDSTDSPYFLVSVIGTRTSARLHLPASGHWRLAEDAVVSPTPLEVLELAPGDSARIVISVLESEAAEQSPEMDGATASTTALNRLAHPLVDSAGLVLDSALVGLRRGGAHWLGSVSLLLSNDGGMVWWRRMDCVEDCAVTKGLAGGAEGVALSRPTNGVYELSGDGGTFHLNLRLKPVE